MDKRIRLSDIKVLLRGGGEMASGVAWRLYQCGFKIFITERHQPLAVRRKVSFSEAVYEGHAEVEGVEALHIDESSRVGHVWEGGKIPVLIDPLCKSRQTLKPDVLIDAIIAKKNLGTSLKDAPLVIALGPGFEAGKDAHFVIETNRGHNLGRILTSGSAEENTGIPGSMDGITIDRVLRAPLDGIFQNILDIGATVKTGDTVGSVAGEPVKVKTNGILRGLIRPGSSVSEGLKIGDIDPRGVKDFCFTISEKARAIGGAVLEGIFRVYGE
jgi:xanthine dehydrogenase accessory factor